MLETVRTCLDLSDAYVDVDTEVTCTDVDVKTSTNVWEETHVEEDKVVRTQEEDSSADVAAD